MSDIIQPDPLETRLADLNVACKQVVALLDARQPGDFSWWALFGQQANELGNQLVELGFRPANKNLC